LKAARVRTAVVRRSLNLVRRAAHFMRCAIIVAYQYQNGGARAKNKRWAGQFGLAWNLLIVN
jgi:hypothetical protein